MKLIAYGHVKNPTVMCNNSESFKAFLDEFSCEQSSLLNETRIIMHGISSDILAIPKA